MSSLQSTGKILSEVVGLRFLVDEIRRSKLNGRTVFLAGNGGSYTTALHWALDLQKVCSIRTHSLGSNAGLLTALSNDTSYESALTGEYRRLSRDEDLLVLLSCSGKSPNLVELLRESERCGRTSILLTSLLCDHYLASHTIRIPSKAYGVIENVHLAILHAVIEEIEELEK